MFQNYPTALFWKVELIVNKNQQLNGVSSLTLLVNQLPKSGFCQVDQYFGVSLSTIFNISCFNFIDPDGVVARYEFFGKIF